MDFYSTLVANGLRPTETPSPDGIIHRCKTDAKPNKKNGWYKLALDGKIGWFGDFTTTLSATWKPNATEMALIPRVDPAALAAKRAEERRVVGLAVQAVRNYWASLKPLTALHPYLEAKQLSIQGCDQLRVDGDALIVPMYRAGALVSLQRIYHGGTKLYWKNAPTKGASLSLLRLGSTVTILAEGFATGLALFQCIPEASVIVCFSADNMAYVAEDINLTGMVVVAADNDWKTAIKNKERTGTATNPGIEKGLWAATSLGCAAVWPKDIEGSDWCDAMIEWNSKVKVRIEVLRGVRRAVPRVVAST